MARTAEKQIVKEVKKIVLVPSEVINTIRSHRAGKLFISNMEFVDVLLAEYDGLREHTDKLVAGKQSALDTVNAELDAATTRIVVLEEELSIAKLAVAAVDTELAQIRSIVATHTTT